MQRVGWKIPAAWLTLCIVWSSTWLAIKVGLRDLPVLSFVAIRFVIATAVLIVVSVGRVRLLPERAGDYLVLALTGVLMFAINYTAVFWGELYVSSGLAAVLQTTITIFGMLFAHWMLPDEPLRLQKLAGALIAIGADGRCHGPNRDGPVAVHFAGQVAQPVGCWIQAGRVVHHGIRLAEVQSILQNIKHFPGSAYQTPFL